ncbi:MAG TPA: M48 family peptidase [Gammaproteobacteria bacterium]|nr:M48 family peptidase [Gammaproteobacteria bacterium]
MLSAHWVTNLFLAALSASVVVRLWLEQRQIRHVAAHRDRPPEPFRGQVSTEAHHKAADYTIERAKLRRWRIVYDAGLLLMWTLGGGLETAWRFASGFGLGELHTGVIMILTVALINGLLEQPFSLYSTFVIEARYGFNRMTLATWLTDLAKGTLLGIAIGAPLLYLVLWLMQSSGGLWWLYAWAALLAFSLAMSWAFPTLIAPLFNKFTPLDKPDLKAAIESLLRRSGFRSKGIFVMDGSRRSSHGNAYFTGLGRQKRIVFFDTLIDSLSTPQIVAVLAHELGHFKHKHILKGLLLSAATSLIGFAILAWLMPRPAFYQGLGVKTPSLAAALLLFVMVSPVFTFFLHPLIAWFSRRHEYEADAWAARQANANDLVNALVRMYEDNASTLTPDALHSSFYDSHPPALARIDHLKRLSTN